MAMSGIDGDGERREFVDPVEADEERQAREKEIDDERMMRAGMRDWFLSNYCDPAEETPFDHVEGDFIWIWGGPYEPGEELRKRFGDIADDNLIDLLAEELRAEGGSEWAPARRDDGYDKRFEFEIVSSGAPHDKLHDRVVKALKTLTLKGDDSAMELIPNLVFSSLISAFEAFLWETVSYWVENDERVLRGLVTKLPALKNEPLKLGEIYGEYEGLGMRVKGYLQNLIWHRWADVAQLFIYGFGFRPPSFGAFEDAILKRHDIVHRSGHDRNGDPVSISRDDVVALAQSIEDFARALSSAIAARDRQPT